eukprot:750797-Hanusia_phi.AAC.2
MFLDSLFEPCRSPGLSCDPRFLTCSKDCERAVARGNYFVLDWSYLISSSKSFGSCTLYFQSLIFSPLVSSPSLPRNEPLPGVVTVKIHHPHPH